MRFLQFQSQLINVTWMTSVGQNTVLPVAVVPLPIEDRRMIIRRILTAKISAKRKSGMAFVAVGPDPAGTNVVKLLLPEQMLLLTRYIYFLT